MKKFFLGLAIFIVLLIGIKIGGNYTSGSSNLFEEARANFEKEIVTPGNNYETKQIIPEEGVTNKIAHTIDDLMQKVINKVLSRD